VTDRKQSRPKLTDPESAFLKDLTREIMAQGYDEATAANYAVMIGDTPCLDVAGNVIVMDAGRPVATLKPLEMFKSSRSKFPAV
jgi:hypothetical protein